MLNLIIEKQKVLILKIIKLLKIKKLIVSDNKSLSKNLENIIKSKIQIQKKW